MLPTTRRHIGPAQSAAGSATSATERSIRRPARPSDEEPTLTSTVDARAADRGEFVRALGQEIGTRVVVYVPRDRPAQALWLAPTSGADAEVGALEEMGRTWLHAARRSEVPPHDVTRAEHVFVTAVKAEGRGALGALVVAKEPGRGWSGSERDFVRFAARYYATALDRRATPLKFPSVGRRWRAAPDLESDMRHALGAGALSLAYQPEFDLLTADVIAVEALLRWSHPTFGDIGPQTVVAVAERSGMLTELGRWVVTEAIAMLAGWHAELPDLDVELRINAAPAQLTGDALVAAFETSLAFYGVPGGAVCLEITEATDADDRDLVQTLGRLKQLGVRSAIDDLAAGYSSLGRLRALPVDVVKIDRTLIAGLHSDLRARTIVTSVLGMAGALGIEAVAEGVEDEADAAVLRELGCRRAQGNLLGHPIPAAEMLDLLRARGHRTPEK